ncbi:MAG: hypothetical protein ACOVNY_00775, partial [Chitinophagaceae bacterium]
INRVLLFVYLTSFIAGTIYYFSFDRNNFWLVVMMPLFLLVSIIIGNKLRPKHPFIQLTEEKISWLLEAGTSIETVIWKEIAWIKREEDAFIFYGQSSFNKYLPLQFVATNEERDTIVQFIVTNAQKTNTKLVYRNTITA